MNAEAPHISIQAEPLSDDLLKELSPLFIAEWEEVGQWKDRLPLSIDLKTMDALARAKRLAIFTVREIGELSGYMIFTLGFHPKYNTTAWATMNGWYLKPSARRPMTAKRMVDFAKEELKTYGAQFCMGACRIDHPEAGKLLEHCGFTPYEVGYLIEL